MWRGWKERLGAGGRACRVEGRERGRGRGGKKEETRKKRVAKASEVLLSRSSQLVWELDSKPVQSAADAVGRV